MTPGNHHLYCPIAFALIALLLSSCDGFGCSPTGIVAELTIKSGTVERDFAKKMNHWQNAPVHATFVTNDGIRTHARSTAELVLQEGSLVVMKPKTQLRFANAVPAQNKYGVVVEEGSAEIDANSNDLQIETGIGLATLKKGSNLKLSSTGAELSIEVSIGGAHFISSTGEVFDLNGGDEILLSIGTAKLVSDGTAKLVSGEEQHQASPSQAQPDTSGENTPETPARHDIQIPPTPKNNGGRRASQKGAGIPEDLGTAEAADFAIVAGQRAFVHASQFPVAVEIVFKEVCPGDAHVKVARQKIWATGARSVILKFPLKSHRYEVRCVKDDNSLGAVTKKGRLTVLRDKGKSNLALSAPVSYIDADGRDYNLMYQSKLPLVVARWPDAPRSDKYKLHITGATGTKTIVLSKPQYRFSSGSLSEGTYKFKFTQVGDSKRSRTSRIKILFDNATPKAILTSPRNGAFSKGETITVSGIALPGWTASVFGKKLTMDSEHRFKGVATHLDKYLSLPVRLSHAKRGTHYFLRRAK